MADRNNRQTAPDNELRIFGIALATALLAYGVFVLAAA